MDGLPSHHDLPTSISLRMRERERKSDLRTPHSPRGYKRKAAIVVEKMQQLDAQIRISQTTQSLALT